MFVYFYVPEVKGRTLEEISEMFEARLPARKFRSYQCVGPAAMHAAKKEEEVSTVEVVWSEPKAAAEQIIAVS